MKKTIESYEVKVVQHTERAGTATVLATSPTEAARIARHMAQHTPESVAWSAAPPKITAEAAIAKGK